jgi:xylulokinase
VGELLAGIDVGTQGVRVVCTTPAGEVVARTAAPLAVPPPGPAQEQDPRDWWEAVATCLRQLCEHRAQVAGLAVACTSGTVCILDDRSEPLMNALLYSDTRAAGRSRFDVSWAAAKLDWLAAERPDVFGSAALFTSPGGYLSRRFTGEPVAVDYSQALKFGYDLRGESWPSDLAVGAERLPPAVPPGTAMGRVRPEVAAELGLGPDVTVCAGLTDGVAAQLACGAVDPGSGRWVTVVGSTLVWKGAATEPIDAAAQGVYSHRGPRGVWLPGAASNAGGRIVSEWFEKARLPELDARVPDRPPRARVYPSLIVGERFPFRSTTFVPFSTPDEAPEDDRYAGCLAGVAFVERWGYEVLGDLGLQPPVAVATTGGAVRSRAWLQLRADVLQVPLAVPAEPGSAFGAAVAAGAGHYADVLEAAEAMVKWGPGVEPRPQHRHEWSDAHERFKDECRRRLEGDESGPPR